MSYMPKSLPHFGKLMKTNEVVALLGEKVIQMVWIKAIPFCG
jgi:hypothetical protein